VDQGSSASRWAAWLAPTCSNQDVDPGPGSPAATWRGAWADRGRQPALPTVVSIVARPRYRRPPPRARCSSASSAARHGVAAAVTRTPHLHRAGRTGLTTAGGIPADLGGAERLAGRLVARLSPDPGAPLRRRPASKRPELEEVAPLLMRSGSGALAWWRERQRETHRVGMLLHHLSLPGHGRAPEERGTLQRFERCTPAACSRCWAGVGRRPLGTRRPDSARMAT